VFVLALMGACGQKGALYLPPKSGTVVTRPVAAPQPGPSSQSGPATRATDDKKDKDSSQQQQPQPPN